MEHFARGYCLTAKLQVLAVYSFTDPPAFFKDTPQESSHEGGGHQRISGRRSIPVPWYAGHFPQVLDTKQNKRIVSISAK